MMRFGGSRVAILVLGLVLLIMSMAVSCALGAVDISAITVLRMGLSRLPLIGHRFDGNWSQASEIIVFSIRLPRVVLGAVIGWGLGSAGAAYQGLFRNPMADPYVIGVSSGAALGAALAITLGLGLSATGAFAVPLMAFVGGLGTVMVVYRVARRGRTVGTNELLLAGVAISALASSLVSLLMVLSTRQLDKVVLWLMGSLAGRGWDEVVSVLPYMVVGFVVVLAGARQLNALLMGDEAAHHLGVDVEKLKLSLLAAGSLMAASAVAVSGVIGFVGLIVPHMMRLVIGPDHRYLLPASAIFGGMFMVISDAIARTVIAPVELPVGVVTALFGAPFFLYLLKTSNRGV